MFSTSIVTTVLAFALLAHADVTPNVPGPGVVYKSGGTCHIEWAGDAESTTAWKGMTIKFMTGDNFNMVPLQTIATNLDGTVSGTFNHPCPDVNPYSAIYFYEFTAPGAPNKQWTTRFAISSPTGATVPPANDVQPDGQKIAWGVGAIVGASGGTSSSGTSGATTTTSTTGLAGATTPAATTPTTRLVTQPPNAGANPTDTGVVIVTVTPTPTPTPPKNGNTTANNTNANGAATASPRLLSAAFALGLSALSFTVFL